MRTRKDRAVTEETPTKHSVDAFIGLGSNQGDRLDHLRRAIRALDAHPELEVERMSPVYETEAHTQEPDERQAHYLNAVAQVSTTLSAGATLRLCLHIEHEAGRRRSADASWEPRSLDLDLLAFGTTSLQTPELSVPHPRLAQRRFVLRPWCDVAPDYHVPPPFEATVADLLAECGDELDVRRIEDEIAL